MPAILPGYEYDIFISYRQNDNRSGWVTDFVNALQDELAATLKDPVSIFFDSNPYDGLHETHDVDGSLKEKVKCLVFVPIVSQTYCDPKSFAWQNEFLPFLEFARQDDFGLDVRLPSGNVAKRVLPIRIHEIDREDQQLFEENIGGVMRPVDFIYKDSGVNRPLRSTEDNPLGNQNQIYYTDQINKVANSIKQIIAGIRSQLQPDESIVDPQKEKIKELNKVGIAHSKRKRTRWIVGISAAAILVIAYYFFALSKNSPQPIIEEFDKSIAVLPFADMSPNKDQEYFSDGLSEELLNLLAKIPELKVIGRTSSFSFKGQNEDLRTIGEKLDVSYLLEGSVRKSGDDIRVTAQLVYTGDGSHVWSETYDRQMNDVFALQDEIAGQVVDQLQIKIPGLSKATVATNMEAYNLMLEANYIAMQAGSWEKEIELMEKAISIDSTDARIWTGLARSYMNWGAQPELRAERAAKARAAAEKAIVLDSDNAEGHSVLGSILRAFYWDWEKAEKEFIKAGQLNKKFEGDIGHIYLTFGKWDEAIDAQKKILANDPINPWRWRSLGHFYIQAGRYQEAIPPLLKASELDPTLDINWVELGWAYIGLQQYEKSLEFLGNVIRKEGRYFSMMDRALLALGKKDEADDYLKQMLESDHEADNSISIATAYARRDEEELCFAWLQKAYERKHPAMSLIKGPWGLTLKELNTERYNEFLKKMNLPID